MAAAAGTNRMLNRPRSKGGHTQSTNSCDGETWARFRYSHFSSPLLKNRSTRPYRPYHGQVQLLVLSLPRAEASTMISVRIENPPESQQAPSCEEPDREKHHADTQVNLCERVHGPSTLHLFDAHSRAHLLRAETSRRVKQGLHTRRSFHRKPCLEQRDALPRHLPPTTHCVDRPSLLSTDH